MRATRIGSLSTAVGMAVLLTACGGGGGGSPAPSPAPQQADVPVTVIDGAIQNAVVCLDKNTNNVCDAGEPTGTTDAAGKVTLKVDPADVGKYPILAQVGTDAVDADHGPVTTAFSMKAPADRTAVISPLTTLVQATIENTGATSADAEAAVKAQIGVSVSLFADFTKATDEESETLETLARVIVVTVQEQSKALASAVGTEAIDGKAITQADINEVISRKMLEALPQVVTKLADPRLEGSGDKGAVISEIAQTLVATPGIGLNTTTLQTLVAVARSTDTSTDTTPNASASMTALNWSSPEFWFRRVLSTSAAQAVPDSSNNVRFVDRRQRTNGGVLANWSFGGEPNRQTDLHWNGTAWVNCTFGQASVSSVRDAQGRSSYSYCEGFETGVSQRSVIDIAGRAMKDVHKQITDAGYTNVNIADAETALGSATFPAESKLLFHVSTPLTAAHAYYPGIGNQVRNNSSAVASGEQSACNAITSSTPIGSYTALATTLESMIAANRGTPCVYTASSATGPRNEWWSQSTVSLGIVGNAPTGGTQTTTYTTNTLLRVAFGANNAVTYYSCQQRATDGSARNCDAIGTGTYTITTLGDGRSLTLNNPPAQASALTYSRVFVERGSRVYFGYQNRLTPSNNARLNLAALNAMSTQLGMPTVDPEVPLTLTTASYQGDWIVNDSSELSTLTGSTIRLSANGGAPTCTENSNGQSYTCSVSINPASGAFTYSDGDGNATGTFSFNTGSVAGTFTPASGPAATVSGMRR